MFGPKRRALVGHLSPPVPSVLLYAIMLPHELLIVQKGLENG
jgi:hypothetical protein